MEINFAHGEPLELADRVFLFKRTVRETALRHGIFATFMDKPMEAKPGSAMHIGKWATLVVTSAFIGLVGSLSQWSSQPGNRC